MAYRCSPSCSSPGQRDYESGGECRCAATLRLPRRRAGTHGSEACVSSVLVEVLDSEFQLVAFFQIKPVSDFFWDCYLPTFSEFWVALHRTHCYLFMLNRNKGWVSSASTLGSSPGTVALTACTSRCFSATSTTRPRTPTVLSGSTRADLSVSYGRAQGITANDRLSRGPGSRRRQKSSARPYQPPSISSSSSAKSSMTLTRMNASVNSPPRSTTNRCSPGSVIS